MAPGSAEYRTLLRDIADELTFSDVGSLKFVCRGKIGAGKLDQVPNDKPLQLIKLLEERLLISSDNLTWLRAILKQIQRMDLVVKIPEELCTLNSSDVTDSGDPPMPGAVCREDDVVPPYRAMLKSISDELTQDNLDEIKFLLNIPDGRAEKMKDGQGLLTYLEGCGQLSSDNFAELTGLLDQIHRKDLTKMIEEFSINEAKSRPMSSRQTRDPASCYVMQRPHGFALIINIKDFKGRTREGFILNERKGSNVDLGHLENMWECLGFQVEKHENLKTRRICTVVQDIAKKIDHNSSCFVCCIMTHGSDSGMIYGSDSNDVNIGDIIKVFNEANCPALTGKPKLFFIQACRGQQRQDGRRTLALPPVTNTTDVSMPGMAPTTTEETRATAALDSDAHPVSATAVVDLADDNDATFRHNADPDEPHFLLGYSTAPGYVSWRSTEHGSWYVNALVEIFSTKWMNEDVTSMMVMVNHKVSEAFTKQGYKQCPVPVLTLTKKIFF